MTDKPRMSRPLMRPDGTALIRQVGVRRSLGRDLYHSLRVASWPILIATISVVFVLSNLGFAFLYRLGGDCIANARPGSFVDAFYFSVQTMATVGYGGMTPVGQWANALVVAEAIYGLLLTAAATGLIFSKFATPIPRVLFSRNVVIAPMRGVPTLMFRVANERWGHLIVEATLRVTLARDEREEHGALRRRLFDLELERDTTPLFQLSWTIFHAIDERSPLHGMTAEELQQRNVGLIITFIGVDDSLSQSVHARHAYPSSAIVFGARFADVLLIDEEGHRYIDYRRFHDLVPLEGASAGAPGEQGKQDQQGQEGPGGATRVGTA